ncbi:MAG: tetratricopeptide repeat protein [Anaerolineae bacterium]
MLVLTSRRGRVAIAAAAALVALVVGLIANPVTRSIAECEMGTAAFRRGLRLHESEPLRPNPYLDQALRHYQRAVATNPGNAYAWRKLCELFLLLGQNEAAKQAIDTALALRPANNLYHILLGDAYDGLGLPAAALDEWSLGQAGAWRRDETIVNLTKLADAHIQAGDPMSALPILEKQVLLLDPTNLFVLATAVSTYDSAVGGPHPLADGYRNQLATLAPEAVRTSSDGRYAEFQARAVADLYRLGYWDQARTEALLRYWLAQGYSAAPSAAALLREADSGNPAWAQSTWEPQASAAAP